MLAGHLREKGETEVIELKAQNESRSFLGQCRRAFGHKKAKLETVNYDLTPYDLICFGSPVWAFCPAPAMNTYLENCSGIAGKKIILFTTYGSGAGNNRCLNYMQKLLAGKGAAQFKKFSIQQFKVEGVDTILSVIRQNTEGFI